METIDDSECFIITPIGEQNSIIRKKTDGLLRNVIEPICEGFSLRALPAHEIDNLGSITNQVVQKILESKLVIANLTGLNPNVMYELAIRHAAKLPVICLAESGTKLPFDINSERTIFYTDDMCGAEDLKVELKKKIESAIKDEDVDNPIYRAIKEKSILKELNLDNSENSSLSYIISRLDDIEKLVNNKIDPVRKSVGKSICPVFVVFKFDRAMSDTEIKTFINRLIFRLNTIGYTILKYSQKSDQELEIQINNLISEDELSKIINGLISKNKLPSISFDIDPL